MTKNFNLKTNRIVEVTYIPNLLERLFGRKKEIIEYFWNDEIYFLDDCRVWISIKDYKEYKLRFVDEYLKREKLKEIYNKYSKEK